MVKVRVKVRVKVKVGLILLSLSLSLFLLPEAQSVVTRKSSVITLRPAILRAHNPKPVTP